jgi:hypothetical protein
VIDGGWIDKWCWLNRLGGERVTQQRKGRPRKKEARRKTKETERERAGLLFSLEH